jgi:hypothetical protein
MTSFEYKKKDTGNLYFTEDAVRSKSFLKWGLLDQGQQPLGYFVLNGDTFFVNGIQVNTGLKIWSPILGENVWDTRPTVIVHTKNGKMIELTTVPLVVCDILRNYAIFRKFLIAPPGNSRIRVNSLSHIRNYFSLGAVEHNYLRVKKFIKDIVIADATILVYWTDTNEEEGSKNCVKLSLPPNQKIMKMFKNKKIQIALCTHKAIWI